MIRLEKIHCTFVLSYERKIKWLFATAWWKSVEPIKRQRQIQRLLPSPLNVGLFLKLNAINLSGTPASTPELKIGWHSFSTPFKWVRTLFSNPIAKFSDRKLQNLKRFSDWISEKIFLRYFNTSVFGTLLSNYPFYSAFTCNIFEQLII